MIISVGEHPEWAADEGDRVRQPPVRNAVSRFFP
jgi:hypothetical protein